MKYDYEDIYLVGVGSSAGGIEALKHFLSSVQSNKPFAYIIVQHLNPQHKSMLTDILSRDTDLPVMEIYNGHEIEAGYVYVTPANANATVRGGRFYLATPEQVVGPKPSVDVLFISLAQEKAEKAIGVVLSGTGSDGTQGLKSIKSGGGLTIAQDPKSAKYDGMPVSAIESRVVDKIMLPEEIGVYLVKMLRHEHEQEDEELGVSTVALNEIFSILNLEFDIDFSVYKSATIMRRIEKRMSSVKARNIDEYLKYAKKNPDEPSLLYNDILIGVTSFYRDTEAFEALANYLKGYLESHAYPELRVWSAACATGEEAYTITMILADLCSRMDKKVDIQVFATDMDESSLSVARSGIYPEIIATAIPKDFLERFFKKKGGVYEVVRSIREKVIFSKHNLLRDPPFLRLDLICCRNLLIYLENDYQNKTLLNFHHSLRAGGTMFLGKSESLGKAAPYFHTLSSKFKIFKSRADVKPQVYEMVLPPAKRGVTLKAKPTLVQKEQNIETAIGKALFTSFISKCVVVDENGNLIFVKGLMEGIASLPTGSVSLNFGKMINQDLSVDFKSLLFKAVKNKTEQRSKPRIIGDDDNKKRVIINIFPLYEPVNAYLVVFDESRAEGVVFSKEAFTVDDERFKTLQDELDATKEHLQTVVEELETSNEELQSSNEELQATNEELETSNEELKSSNEELQTAYIELKMVYEEQAKQRAVLEEANRELLRLNNELNSKEHYISALLDAEQAIVMVTRMGEEIVDANQGFFNFFSQYSTLEEFKSHHRCICEFFEDVDGDDSFLPNGFKKKDGKNWLETVLGSGVRQKKVIIRKDGAPYIFSVHANNLDSVNQKYVVVFSNITDIEEQRDKINMLTQKQIESMHQKERVLIQRATLLGASDFLQGMSSSWREPLAKISNLIRDLSEDTAYGVLKEDRIKEFEKSTLASLKGLVASVEEAREFFAVSKSHEYFDLSKIVSDAIKLSLGEAGGKNLEIELVSKSERVDFYGFADEMRYLVNNLINLYKSIPQIKNIKKLKITLEQVESNAQITISCKDEGSELEKHIFGLLSSDASLDGSMTSEIEIMRMKIIKSVVESEFGGSIDITKSRGFTHLNIIMKMKSF